jgi:hypothetical protein
MIKNKTPDSFLTGSNTHAANLTGASSVDNGVSGSDIGPTAGGDFDSTEFQVISDNTEIASTIVNIASVNSKIVISASVSGANNSASGASNTATFEVRRNGANIQSFTGISDSGGDSWHSAILVIDTGQVGNTTYSIHLISRDGTINFSSDDDGAGKILVQEFILNDTHAANLTGANTQAAESSKLNQVIQG